MKKVDRERRDEREIDISARCCTLVHVVIPGGDVFHSVTYTWVRRKAVIVTEIYELLLKIINATRLISSNYDDDWYLTALK